MPSAPPEAPTVPASGAHDLVGYDIDLAGGDGRARVMLDIAPRHLNRNGSLHGGIIAMMLDAAAGYAASLAPGNGLKPVVTVALTTQFLHPARAGERVTATGFVKRAGGVICHADAELHGTDDTLLATAHGVFKFQREREDG